MQRFVCHHTGNIYKTSRYSTKENSISFLTDKRGKQQGGHNRTSEKKTEEIMKQIRMIPKYKSHYRREQCDAEYLPPGMTLQDMYDAYVKDVVGACQYFYLQTHISNEV